MGYWFTIYDAYDAKRTLQLFVVVEQVAYLIQSLQVMTSFGQGD